MSVSNRCRGCDGVRHSLNPVESHKPRYACEPTNIQLKRERKRQNYDQKKGHKNSSILIWEHPFDSAHALDWDYMGNEAIS